MIIYEKNSKNKPFKNKKNAIIFNKKAQVSNIQRFKKTKNGTKKVVFLRDFSYICN